MRQYKMQERGDPFLVENNSLRRVPPNFHIQISLTMIKYFGTWPPKDKFRFLYLVVQFINLIIIWGDVPSMVASAFLLMTNSVHAYKIFLILGNQNRIQRILDMLESDKFSKDRDKFERIFTWYAWQGIYHYLRYQSFGTMAVFCWGFTPIADAISGHARRLPMEAWYPYDTKATPAFQITCAHQSFAIMLGCFHNISMDTLITGLLNVACCQFEVVKKNILELDVDGGSKEIDDARLRKELHSYIQHTVDVMGFIEEVRNIFGNVVLVQLLVNCIIICLTAFHISQMTVFVPVETFGMITYMCCMTYQIFIYCWHGNELTLQSQSLSQTVFSSNWWKFNKKLNNDLGIVITRFCKPIIFMAGPLMELSLQRFILRLSYSFFTLLKSTTVPQ
ncbi:odorant receptor Or1-like [Diachasma alloeum]|uniref:Odorant receptor n=1 Tax=Diachasma alloeum TaxID=454923 RepID=A0A4E0RP17_9HYME|nr:odorant receptor Or1-like [Diachasma alloeum]THK33166.1 odorant receptor 125F [Diachasma alloeum]